MRFWKRSKSVFSRFCRDESGVTTIEFVIIFPVFVGFFLMTVESGMIAVRHVMLERGVDVAVRDVRIGTVTDPTTAVMRERICEAALIIPNCEDEIEVEMTRLRPTVAADFTNYSVQADCIDRSGAMPPNSVVNLVENNDLVVLRACVRINPFLPTSILGKTVIEANQNDQADGSYSLVSLSAFVMEPHKPENE